MIELVQSHTFYVEVTDAYPTGNSSVTLRTKDGVTKTLGAEGHISLSNNRGELILIDSVASAHFPFFGRAYSHTPGEDGGFEFNKQRLNPEMTVVNKRKKQFITYKFSVRSSNDQLQFQLEIYANGSCNVSITSNNRAPISYTGKLTVLPEEKAALYR